MPVSFDSPEPAKRGVVFDDAPRSGVVFDEPSPYTEVIADAQASARDNTLESISQRVADSTDSLATDTPGVYRPSTAAKVALRVAPPLAAGLLTGGLGLLPAAALTAGAGGLGELGAQGLEIAGDERQSVSLPQLGAATLLSGVPAAPLTRIASPIARGGIRVAEGAALGAAAPTLEAGFQGRLPNIEDVGASAALGGLIGVPFGGLEFAAARAQPNALQRIATDVAPTELGFAGGALNEPIEGLPAPTMTRPAELTAVNKVREEFAATQAAAAERALQQTSAEAQAASAAKAQALGERMMGVESPEGKLAILDQELALQKDTLTDAERRAGLDMKLLLKQQIDQQKALETAAREEAAGIKAQQAALADVQEAAQLATPQAPEVPKSTQIVEEVNAPKSLANAAAIGAKNAEGNLTQLQTQINEVAVAPALVEPVAAPLTEPVNIGPRDETISTGTGVETPAEVNINAKQRKMIEEYLKEPVRVPEVEEAAVVTPNEVVTEAIEVPRAPTTELRLNNANLGLPPVSSLNASQKLRELESAGITTYNGKPIADANPAQLSNALGKFRRGQLERGAVNPAVLTPLATTGAGVVYGASQGDSLEERAKNAALYGSIGLSAGTVGGAALQKLTSRPMRIYQSPVLKDVAQMLTPIEEKTSLFEKLADAYGNFRFHFNTKFAPIGQAQRALYKEAGRTFTPSRYYDLERGFERLSGAPVQAEGEVELLQNIVSKLPNQDVPHLDSYLTLSRIEDRLLKTAEENASLQDAVGRAQAELDAAVAANASNPGVRNSAAVTNRRDELSASVKRLREDFDRKRVGDWSIAKAQQGLADLQAEIGPDAYQRLQQAGREYQQVMNRALQIQVDSGRMTQDLMDRVLASNDFYAPFKVLKYFEDEQPFITGGGMNRIPSSEQLVKRITGIDDTDVRIGSPTNVAAEQVYKGYILAQKNRKLRELATLTRLDKNGDYVAPLAAGMEPKKGFEAVTYFQNGEPKRLEVAKPIAKSLSGVDINEASLITKVLARFGQVFKLGATGLNIPFNISNALIFDPLRLATISRYGFRGPQDFLYTLYEWPRALFSSARGNLGQAAGIAPDALYEQWIKSGAAGSTLARQLTPEAFASRLPKDMKMGEALAETNFGLGAPIKVASLISNTLEETTKLLGLQRATRLERLDKLTPQQREQKWDEIVTEIRNYAGSPDFSRAGVSMKPLNILLPFLNARWQGTLADTARLNPFRQGNAADAGAAWARLGSLVAIPAGALAYYNLSTPENERDYLQIPKTEREKYFHIPLQVGPDGNPTILDTGKGYYFKNKDGVDIRGYYRIPKREMPGLMSNTIEDFAEYLKATHPESFAQLMGNLAENTAQTLSPINVEGDTLGERALSAASGVNPALRLPVEVGLNRNLYTGQPIVPQGREKASPKLQFANNTPQAYRDAAQALPDIAPDALRSPAKLQHITEGLTGGFVRQFATPTLSEGNPAGNSSPLLGRFYRSERVESEDMMRAANEAERGRADQRIQAQDLASKLADVIQSKPTPAAKEKALNDAARAGLLTQDVQTYLKDDLLDAQRGLTYEDRVVKRSYSVAGGFRARYYIQKLQEIPPADRAAYLQDQFQKGLLSRDVQGQMAALMQRP